MSLFTPKCDAACSFRLDSRNVTNPNRCMCIVQLYSAMCLYAGLMRGERSFVFVCYLCVEGGCVVLCACALCNVLTVSSSICAAGAVLHLNAALIVSWMPEPQKGLRWRGDYPGIFGPLSSISVSPYLPHNG